MLLRTSATILYVLTLGAWFFALLFIAAFTDDPHAFDNLAGFILPVVISISCFVLTIWGLINAWHYKDNRWLLLGLPMILVSSYFIF